MEVHPQSGHFERVLSEARGGSQEALGALMESCREYINCIASQRIPRSLQSRVSASSLVQETYLRACRKFSQFRGQSERQLLSWLRTILIRCLLNYIQRDSLPTVWTGRQEIQIDPQIIGPDQAAEQQEARQQVLAALAQLPWHYRAVIELHQREGFTFAEVGQVLSLSEEATRKVWVRALVRLGQLLQRYQ